MDLHTLSNNFPALLDSGKSIELVGPPGVGKSDFVRQQVAAASVRTGQEWGFATLFLATMTPPDLLGYMVPDHDSRGNAVSRFTMPPWMQTSNHRLVSDYPRGILFLDEYGQGDADVKRASAELLLNRRIGPWELPDGWSVIAASNRAKDRSGVTKAFDFVINRRVEINIDPSVSAWEKWAMDVGIDPLIQFFATQNPGIVFDGDVPKEQGPWCTPRSLVAAGDVLHALRGGNPDREMLTDAVARELVAGTIGNAATLQLMATLTLAYNMPSVADIIANPETTSVPDKPDAAMLVAHQLASYVEVDTIDPISTYMERFPREFSVSFATQMMKRSVEFRHAILETPAMSRWIKANGALFAAIQ